MSISTIGIDIGKSRFHVCALDEHGHVQHRKAFSRSGLIRFLANTPPARVATEACAGAHFIGRKAESFGHEARLLPAQYVTVRFCDRSLTVKRTKGHAYPFPATSHESTG